MTAEHSMAGEIDMHCASELVNFDHIIGVFITTTVFIIIIIIIIIIIVVVVVIIIYAL